MQLFLSQLSFWRRSLANTLNREKISSQSTAICARKKSRKRKTSHSTKSIGIEKKNYEKNSTHDKRQPNVVHFLLYLHSRYDHVTKKLISFCKKSFFFVSKNIKIVTFINDLPIACLKMLKYLLKYGK